MHVRLRRPSHATVVAYLALFVALSGSAVANRKLLIKGSDIKAHSITSRDLAKGAVTARALARNAVQSSALAPSTVTNLKALLDQIDGARIKDGTITASKLAPGSVTDDAVAPGTLTGDRLANGTVGRANLGADAVARIGGWQVIQAAGPDVALDLDGNTATCPAGTQVLGGGVTPSVEYPNPALNGFATILNTNPVLNADGSSGWTASLVWDSFPKSGWHAIVYALCGSTPTRTGTTAP
jgi:hypothetical protein